VSKFQIFEACSQSPSANLSTGPAKRTSASRFVGGHHVEIECLVRRPEQHSRYAADDYTVDPIALQHFAHRTWIQLTFGLVQEMPALVLQMH
jgi:hypothetical protein